MPAEGLEWVPRDDLLTFEEIARVARIMVERYGVNGIRLTGGEPTVRANLPVLVQMLAELGTDLAMTTNGVSLPLLAADLRAAGLRRLNVSCDSLRADRFAQITRRDGLARVLKGIDAALDAGFDPVKINCVVMRGVNDDEIADFVDFGRSKRVEVRFIEFMPLDADGIWTNDLVVPVNEILARVNEASPVEPVERTSAPASRYPLRGRIGPCGHRLLGQRLFLLDLRPGAPHRRRAVPQLPVRGDRDGPPRPVALRCRRRRDRGRAGGVGRVEVGRSPDQQGELHQAPSLDVADRRLRARGAGPAEVGG